TTDELQQRTRTIERATDELHQWPTDAAPFSPVSSSRANRSSEKPVISGCGTPVATVCAIVLPEIGVALNPQVPQPASRKNPSQGVVPMMGAKSGVMSAMPAH